MTITQKRKILQSIVDLEADIAQLRQVRIKLASAEFASATLASGGGSKSYTRADVGKISATIIEMQTELKRYRKMLKETSFSEPTKIVQVWF